VCEAAREKSSKRNWSTTVRPTALMRAAVVTRSRREEIRIDLFRRPARSTKARRARSSGAVGVATRSWSTLFASA
jgi:hypothetical protein